MNDEFEKALAKVRFEESPTTVGNPFKYAFNKGANWAFEWCEDKIEQAFHIQRTERTRVEHWEAKLQALTLEADALAAAAKGVKHYVVDFDAGHKRNGKPTKCQKAIKRFAEALDRYKKIKESR